MKAPLFKGLLGVLSPPSRLVVITSRHLGIGIRLFLASLKSLHYLPRPCTSCNNSLTISLLSLEKGIDSVRFVSSGRDTAKEHGAGEFLLEQHEEENALVIWKAIRSVNNRSVEDVIQSLQRDKSCCHIQLSLKLVDSLLERFGDDWKSALGVFLWVDSQSGYKHTAYAYNRMVDLLGKMKQISQMWELVNRMCGEGLLTIETIAKIMRRLAGAGRWKDAIKVFDDLEIFRIDKDTESMNLLLDTLCKERKVEVARDIFLKLKAHIIPNAHTFNIFVHGWCNARRIDEAKWTILEMKGYGFKPSVITYSTILQVYCNRFNYQSVYELLDEMEAEGCPPNVVTYTTIMSSLARSCEVGEVMSVLNRMKSSRCKPDTLFYNSLINALGRAGRLERASHTFKVLMQENGVALNVITYNTMISIFCHHDQEQNALDALKEMENLSFQPDLQTYSPLLKLCFRRWKGEVLLRNLLSDIVDKHHLGLDLATYTLLIHGLCKIGKVEWACLLFDEMMDREILPRIRTCKLLIDGAELRNMYEVAERIANTMKLIELGSKY